MLRKVQRLSAFSEQFKVFFNTIYTICSKKVISRVVISVNPFLSVLQTNITMLLTAKTNQWMFASFVGATIGCFILFLVVLNPISLLSTNPRQIFVMRDDENNSVQLQRQLTQSIKKQTSAEQFDKMPVYPWIGDPDCQHFPVQVVHYFSFLSFSYFSLIIV